MTLRERLRSLFRAYPLRTMAIWLALIALVFLTRNGWEAWVVERELPQELGSAYRVNATPDGRRLLVLGMWSGISIWDIESGRRLGHLNRSVLTSLRLTGSSYTMTRSETLVSPDGRQIVAVTRAPFSKDYLCGAVLRSANDIAVPRRDVAVVVDTETGALRFVLEGHTGAIATAAFSPDSSRIVTAGDDRTARVWDAGTGGLLLVLRGHDDEVNSVAYSPDGARIVTAGSDYTARVWDARTGALLTVLEGQKRRVWRAEYSSDGTRLVGLCEGLCRLWDAKSGALVAVLKPASSFALSPAGKRICTIDRRSKIAQLWDTETGSHVATLDRHEDRVWLLRFSPDGARVVMWFSDHSLRAWDAENGKCLFSLSADDRTKYSFAGTISTGKLVAAIPEAKHCCPLGERRLLVLSRRGKARILCRIRPEWWWGVFYLRHFWLIAALSLALALSVWKDERDLRRGRPG